MATPSPTQLTAGGTYTQGQSIVDPGGRVGTVNFDAKTGQRLSSGASTTTAPNPVSSVNTSSAPISTPVVSSKGAQDVINNHIKPVIQNYDTAMNAGGYTRSQADAADQAATTDMKFLPGSGKPNKNYVAPKTEPAPPPTAESALIDAPDIGKQKAYNSYTGEREDQPLGHLAAGYSTLNPKERTDVVDSVDAPGATYKKFSDGTYGRFTGTGDYSQANSADFAQGRSWKEASDAADNAKKGLYNPAQQSQIDAIMASAQAAVRKQETANANLTGGMAISVARSGLGGQILGDQMITKTVTDGLQAVADLNSQRDLTISKMKEAFMKEDTDTLHEAFSQYNTASHEIQTQIDRTQAAVANQKAKQETKDASFADSMFKKYDAGIEPTDTRAEVYEKLKNSPKYQADQQMAASLAPDERDFYTRLQMTGASKYLGSIGGYGKAGIEEKYQTIKSLFKIAQSLNLSPEALGQSLVDKTSAAKTYSQLQKVGEQLSAQEIKTESDFELLKKAGTKLPQNEITSSIPLIQDWIRSGTLKTTNNAAINNYLGLLTTTLTNYARVVNSQTGSSGTTVAINEEVQKLIGKGLSPATVNDYIDNIAIPEMHNTIKSYTAITDKMDGIIRSAVGNPDGVTSSNLMTDNKTPTGDKTKSDVTSGWAGF